jgi:hypothetical protein
MTVRLRGAVSACTDADVVEAVRKASAVGNVRVTVRRRGAETAPD